MTTDEIIYTLKAHGFEVVVFGTRILVGLSNRTVHTTEVWAALDYRIVGNLLVQRSTYIT